MNLLFNYMGVQISAQSKNSYFISTNIHLEIPVFGQQKAPIKSGLFTEHIFCISIMENEFDFLIKSDLAPPVSIFPL